MSYLDKLEELASLVRDTERASLEDAAKMVDDLITQASVIAPDFQIVRVTEGPDEWVWKEVSANLTYGKVFTLRRSTAPEMEGYPFLVISQMLSSTLDIQVTTCGLLIGKTPDAIARSMNNAIINFAGALGGFRTTAKAISRGGPTEGLIRAISLDSDLESPRKHSEQLLDDAKANILEFLEKKGQPN